MSAVKTAQSAVLIGTISLCCLTTALAAPNDTNIVSSMESSTDSSTDLFPDLKIGSEYYLGVKYLKDLGLIQGYPDGTFKPKQLVNRAEAMKILTGAIEYHSMRSVETPIASLSASGDATAQLDQSKCPLPDLDPQAWYFPYVCQAYRNGVISGYPDGTFRPAQTINKVEALKMDLLQAGVSLQTDFTDNFDDISPEDWFWDYARIANEKSIIVEDRKGNLNPAETLNRGDFSMLVYRTIKAINNHSEFGRASYYGGRFNGSGTASGESFNINMPTAAHKTLPFNTIVRITNLTNGKSVDVRINDRGPYVNGTIVDLSTTAFAEISSLSTGIFQSELEILDQP